MDQDNHSAGVKRDNSKIKIILCALIWTGLLVFGVYELNMDSTNQKILIGVGFTMLVISFFLVVSILQLQFKSEKRREEQYKDVSRAEKASYLLIRKSFADLDERLSYLEKRIGMSSEDIIKAQKAVGKVTINRNRENTDAILNASDKLLTRLMELEEKSSEDDTDKNDTNLDEIVSTQKSSSEELKDKINTGEAKIIQALEKQQEEMVAQQDAMKNELAEIVDKLNLITIQLEQKPERAAKLEQTIEKSGEAKTEQQRVEEPVIEEAVIEEPVIGEPVTEEAVIEEPVIEEPIMEEPIMEEPLVDELALEEEPVVEEPLVDELTLEEEPVIEESIVEEPVIEEPLVDELALEDEEPIVDDMNIDLSEETLEVDSVIDDLNLDILDDVVAEEDAVIEEPVIEEPVVEEPVIEEPVIEEPVIEKPVAETKPPMPDLSNPNKVMSADEIAALIANTSVEEVQTKVEKPPVEETKPPMPDLSDPNKVMSADEIAALIANM